MEIDRKKLFKKAMNFGVINQLNVILVDAYYKGIPEIRLIPEELLLKVFYVERGTSSIFRVLPRELTDGIMARIKLMAGLSIDSQRKIVNASFDFDFDPQKVITFSVSIAPAKFGDKIILKLQQ